MGGIKPKHEHSDRDRIFTPFEVVVDLIQKIPAEKGDVWCDPCLGDGVFYKYFPEGTHEWFEIDKGKDFLTTWDKWDWCVTNIPFSRPKEFIFKMAECSKKGFGILCLANSMTATRLKKLEGMGLYLNSQTTIYIKEWGFGYRTDFYVFTRNKNDKFETMIF